MTPVDEFCNAVEHAKMTKPGSQEWHDAHARMRELHDRAHDYAARHDRRARWLRAVVLVAISVLVSWLVLK